MTLCIVAAMVLFTPFFPAPVTSVRWHGAQALGVELGAVLLLMTLLYQAVPTRIFQAQFRAALTLPALILCVSLLWSIFSWVLCGATASATQGLILLASGVLVVNTVAYRAQTEQSRFLLMDAVMAAGLLVAFSGIALYGSGSTLLVVGVLHDHALFGAFLMLPMPLSLAMMLAPVSMMRRLFAQATLLACVTALIMAQTRSSWVGGSTALLTFGGLLLSVRGAELRYSADLRKPGRLVQASLIPALTIVAFCCFLWLSPERATLTARVRTLTTSVVQGKDASTQWRFTAWAGARAMIRRKPLMGWGIGSYARHQYVFTHTGRPAGVVDREGPTISDETHNSYLQLWAEMGVIGLGLWLLFLASFFVVAISSLRGLVAGSLEQYMVISGLSAVAGQTVDAFANPAWQFGHIMLPFWIIVGLTLSPLRRQKGGPVAEADDVTTKSRWATRLAQWIVILMIGGALVRLILRTAFALPAPYL